MGLLDYFAKKQYIERQPSGNRRLVSLSGGSRIDGESSMEVSAFYSGVIYISQQMAKLPWQVKDKDNEVLFNSRINNIIDLAPNDETNAFIFRLKMTQDALIYGNGYAEIERDLAGRVVAMWPMNHSDVNPYRDENGVLLYRVVGGAGFGKDRILTKRNIFHLKNFHTRDGVVGLGLVDYARETLGIAKGADKFASSLYENGGMPSGVLETEGQLDENVIERLKESWKQKYGGRKTGGTAILEEGLTYKPISHDPQVLQFIESRQFSVLEIARFLRLPPTKLFDTSGATFNNIENANLEVATDTLDAWARNYEAEADVKLLNNRHSGYKTEFDMRQVFRGDMKTRGTYFKDRMQTGSLSPNEIRKMEGDSPYKGGDEFYIATNNYTPQSRVDEVIDSQINKSNNKESNDAIVARYLSKR